ncbi:sensor histidine kinase [Terriglobus roseus]|uniref:histidine kinase n=1 Tax=Terriglobus roseus TaxID=392734 RepID=A0A1H4IU85_9BACT|nr:ATP-binding protein [Terriglobus roseus]SEB37654.1 PAS fold [Terriglobus roseus]
MASERDDRGGNALPRRIPLGRSRRRLYFERRIWLFLWLLSLPGLLLTLFVLYQSAVEPVTCAIVIGCFLIVWAFAISLLMEQIKHPLQTLANVVSALRTEDYSFRARGGRRNDAMGDLALELNRLADGLQSQRAGAMEAVALLDRVMSTMTTPILAFDHEGALRMLNPAAEHSLGLQRKDALNRNVFELDLEALLAAKDAVSFPPSTARWLVRRSTFRLQGIPHTLFLLSDISAALREEERVAWERLVRVLGHEINNSLAPIKSIAGSLRQRLPLPPDEQADIESGLEIIETRADSLNRFLQAYRQLLALPTPRRASVSIAGLIQRVAHLETRVPVDVVPGEDVSILIDADQIQQALINIVRNSAEACMSQDVLRADRVPLVEIQWGRDEKCLYLSVTDNGIGLTNADNLFVPFYTTKLQGSGIGLALAQQIAQAHRGSVRLANRTDGQQGCRAELELPLT